MGFRWFYLFSFSLTFFFFFFFSEARTPTSSGADAMSLLSFKSFVSLDPSNLLSSWKNSTDHCRWFGVTCNRFSRRVVSLNFSDVSPESSLAGTLSSSVAGLSQLRVLSIPFQRFSGQIPGPIGKLRRLEVLELQGNNFSGEIPAQIAQLHSLRLLNLSYNLFSGPLPEKLIGSGKISAIDVSNNQISGRIGVDTSGGCGFLSYLKLSNNFFTDEIPIKFGKCRNLRTLLLDGNILEGQIPSEMGNLKELQWLDVSRNSLTERIPKELASCGKLSVLVLTNLVDYPPAKDGSLDSAGGEFNAFVGAVPSELLSLPSLEIFWAPRANLGGRLANKWSGSCKLRVLNLGQNYINGVVPESINMCKNLTFLDLSSNNLRGFLHPQLRVSCMVYFNISRNHISGVLPTFNNGSCESTSVISYEQDSIFGLGLEEIDWFITHDFSWNSFVGSFPFFSVGDELLGINHNFSYRLLLNNNRFNGSLPAIGIVPQCNETKSLFLNLSSNQLSGDIDQALLGECLQLTDFEAANNQIGGSFGPDIVQLVMLQRLDLRGNKLSGSLPRQLGNLKNLKWLLLGENNLTGEIPHELGKLASLVALDLSQNGLTGSIPASLTKASSLETVLLDHNRLSGEIPSSFSTLYSLTELHVSFNNLSGHIPHLQHVSDCDSFEGNKFLHSCPDQNSAPPAKLPVPLEVERWKKRKKLKTLIIAMVTCASIILCVLVVIVFLFVFGRRKLVRQGSLRRKVVVTFADAPSELNYDNVVKATGNFSMKNLIGTGGFGSTYKAELVPGFVAAVKRLSIGRFQGAQQFEAEIKTLGRVRHKNLVTLIGYYVGEAEMLLIYNYLSGGNLDTFIHDRSGKKVEWAVILKIALDIAQALDYLHYSCVPRIVHRDIKPSNILLDEQLNAYLSDFGLAKLLEVSETHATTDVAGTFGYVAPEYALTCRVSDKADVYSFGVVLLELMSGKKSLDPSFSNYGNGFNIVAWAKLLIREDRCSELFSPELWEAGPKESLVTLLRLASTCTVEALSIRPTMKQVLQKLKQLNN
ncbi:hypothetical protein UlMin_013918 [Ulmus minor]